MMVCFRPRVVSVLLFVVWPSGCHVVAMFSRRGSYGQVCCRRVGVSLRRPRVLIHHPAHGTPASIISIIPQHKPIIKLTRPHVPRPLAESAQDHHVIVEDKTGNSRYLSISGGSAEVLDFLAGYRR